MNDVIGFADFIKNRAIQAPVAFAAQSPSSQSGFTRRDCEDLEEWSSADRRVSMCSSETGTFAMMYVAGRPWASWGVVRQGRSVLLWDCVTHVDIGLFPSMIAALAAVPSDDFPVEVANIIEFAAFRAPTASMF